MGPTPDLGFRFLPSIKSKINQLKLQAIFRGKWVIPKQTTAAGLMWEPVIKRMASLAISSGVIHQKVKAGREKVNRPRLLYIAYDLGDQKLIINVYEYTRIGLHIKIVMLDFLPLSGFI